MEFSRDSGSFLPTATFSARAGEFQNVGELVTGSTINIMDLREVRSLVILFSDDVLFNTLVLKGGNALDIVYDIEAVVQ